MQSATAGTIAAAVKECLAAILPDDQKSKLIYQACDGASNEGCCCRCSEKDPGHVPKFSPHPLLCTPSHSNNVTGHTAKRRNVFSDLGGFATFISSPKCTAVLCKVGAHGLPTYTKTNTA